MRLKKIYTVLLAISVFLFILICYVLIADVKPLKKIQNPTTNCGRYPTEADITTDNVVWQVLQTPNGFIKILNAYLDTRQKRTIIRINVNSREFKNKEKIFCQLWFDDDDQPFVVEVTEFILMWRVSWGKDTNSTMPYLLTCPLDFHRKLPIAVSLTAGPCEKAENLMKIINNQPPGGVKKTFGICSKQFSYTDPSFVMKFIEWIHLVNILGAEKVHFYNKYLHPDLFKVKNYFEAKGLLETWPFLEPSGIHDTNPRSFQTYYLEQNMLNDCFYRIRNLFEFIAVFDFDEVIMPVEKDDLTWYNLFQSLNMTEKKGKFDAFYSSNVFYPEKNAEKFPGIPKYLHMLQHIQRSVLNSVPGHAVKSFYDPTKIVVIHNHLPVMCLHKNYEDLFEGEFSCKKYEIPTEISQNSHYRDTVFPEFNATREDKLIWKFKDQLIEAVNETLMELGIKPDN